MGIKISIVTGGSSGLGFAIAKQLLKEGLNICLVSRSEETLLAAADLLKSAYPEAVILAFPANVGVETDVASLYEYLELGKYTVDKIFNTAGIGRFGPPDKITSKLINDVFEANLTGNILMSSYALRAMKDKGGVIVNVLSTAALTGKENEAVYCAAKWGARGFTEAIKAATKGSNIRVIAVYPGGINTPFWSGETGASVNASKFMEPSDVAKIIVDSAIQNNSTLVSDITINRST